MRSNLQACNVLSTFVSAAAQTVQDSWISPSLPDFAETWTNGEQRILSWDQNLWRAFAAYAPSADESNVDLWCMGYDIHQYAHLIAVDNTFSQSWKINIPDDELSQASKWVFGFLSHGTTAGTADLGNDSVSSPGVIILAAPSVLTVTTTASATSSISSTESSSLSTLLPVTPSPVTQPNPGGLSKGSKAGIGVGVGVGVGSLALIGIGFVLARRIKGRSPTTHTNFDHDTIEKRTQNVMHNNQAFGSESTPRYSELDHIETTRGCIAAALHSRCAINHHNRK